MNVVGRVGSLISQGVYSVATPFHPFGGAVDIIVVEQEDGTYRSTPWYVCFGKFQGVLKVAEKIVTISVNGVGANFHMFLDNSGKAYFMREVMSGSDEAESSGQVLDESETLEMSQSGEIDGGADDHHTVYSEIKEEVENNEHSYGFLDEQSPRKCSAVSSGFSTYHYGSLNEVEDLVKSSDASNLEMVLVSIDGHVLTAPILSDEGNTDNVQLSNPQFHLGPGEGSSEEFGASGDVWEVGDFGDLDASISKNMDTLGNQLKDLKDGGKVTVYVQENHVNGNSDMGSSSENLRAGISKDEMFKSCLDLTSHIDGADSPTLGSPSIVNHSPTRADRNIQIDASESVSIGMKILASNPCVDSRCKDNQVSVSETLHSCDPPCCASSPEKNIETEASEEKPLTIENTLNTGSGGGSPHSSTNDHEQMGSVPGRSAAEEERRQTNIPALQRSISGLGFEISLCGNLLQSGIGRDSAEEAFEAHRISEDEFKESGSSIIKNENLIVRFAGRYFPWDKAAHIILGKAVFGSHFSIEPKDSIPVEHEVMVKAREDSNRISPSNSRRWRLWSIPFRRGKSLQRSDSNSSNKELFVDSESVFQNPDAEPTSNGKNTQSPRKQFLRTNIPTTEQIASLNLKEGQNMIAFSFSTRVLGKQQVDAHVYLWKWNAKIVISDVDGTITKSDVLGQFMPLVGKDWTQSGVARFFSAIKENGYQLLFLSARAIVQAYLTRSFLLNLKQDGKALPSGPVVISPDGLFPSLYREVVRRAPHEFKIACLEDIRALFPSDYNPFYAGFGNRDTDELSYRKIGIPKGKIFIINPKGEVAINHCIDVKSYTSLHTLVNDMFPSTSLVEQEDFNSWNYWKTPLPNIDC